MVLGAIMKNVPAVLCRGSWAVEIDDITDDSRKVKEGSLFICIKGMETDGHKYMKEAVEKGAAALLINEDFYKTYWQDAVLDHEISVLTVEDTRKAAAGAAAAFYGYPSKEIRVIGITGTKGKTTTAFMIRDIFEKAGYKTGLLGTIDYEVGKRRMPSERTTPEAIDIQRYLRQMVDAGCLFAVMEVSSQGLKLHRADCINFDVGVYTNLGNDHIGVAEHTSIEEYAACKSLLFRKCQTGIGNKDDGWYPKIFEHATCKKKTFSCEKVSDYRAEDVTLTCRNGCLGTLFRVGETEYSVSVPGIFSVYNALAAIAVADHYGMTPEVIRDALGNFTVKGRVEIVRTGAPYMVLIDYAHNALSLKNILMTMRRYHPRRLMVLFGCGGGRSKARRREMGRIAGKYADFTVITSDNPRYEQPEVIMQEIEDGMKQTKGEYVMISDRYRAIRYLLEMAGPGDILILAGKGHEMYQEIKDKKIPFDERKIVENIQNELMEKGPE